jgi:hypothetical protein
MKNQSEFLHLLVRKKYQKLHFRLLKAIISGRFTDFSGAKKRQLLLCLSRYEKRLKQWGTGVMTSVAMLFPAVAQTQPVPSGGEFRVNTTTPYRQITPSVASDDDGNFVIAWESSTYGGGSNEIYAQRYNNSGLALGSEFLVSISTGEHKEPSVGMDSDGDFVITWISLLPGNYNYDIYAQRFSNNGTPQGNLFQVNTYTISYQGTPVIDMDSAGNFVIAWSSCSQDGSGCGIYTQKYNSEGVPQGTELQVNTYTTGAQTNPDIAMDNAGKFVVVWNSYEQDGSNFGIYGQLYNSIGESQGSEFLVNSYTADKQFGPSIAMDNDGNFVIVWSGKAQDGDDTGVFSKRYNSAGLAQGEEFQVNIYTTSCQIFPSIAIDDSGDFVIVLASEGQDGSSYGIYGQAYNSAGAILINEFQINTKTGDSQFRPQIAMDSDGDFIVTWQSYAQDGSYWGIYAQRYEKVLDIDFVEKESQTLAILQSFPNPVENDLTIQLYSPTASPLKMILVDVLGRIIRNTIIEVQCGIQSIRVDLGHFPAGNYYIQLTDGTETVIEKIIKNE